MPLRTFRVLAVLMTATLSVACDQGEAPVVWSDPFCASVMPTVEAWLDSVTAVHPTPPDDRYGGTLVAAGIGELSARGGMNAFVAGDYASRMHQQFVNLMTLLQYDENLETQPYLAESFEMSPDGTAVTFHLRRDVFWHDGHPTTARDVAFTYRRITDPALGYPNDSFWKHWVRGDDGVEVLDDYTVRMHLRPHNEALDPWTVVGIMPEHLLADVPVTELSTHPVSSLCPVGNGPFVFREHLTDQRWTFAANPAFPGGLGGRPFVDRYVYRFIAEQATLLTELLTGGIDFYVAVAPEQVARIEEAEGVYTRSFAGRNYAFLAMNARRPQFADARVRRALAMGWNRREYVEVNLGGYGSLANGPVPPAHWAFDSTLADALPYDPEGAARLLDEAGWIDRDGDGIRENTDGVPLSFEVAYNEGNLLRQNAAEFMQSQLRAIGVDAQARVTDYGELLSRAMNPDSRDYDTFILVWTVEFRLDDTDLFHSRSLQGGLAFSGTDNPEIDRLIDILGTIDDRAEALPIWREYQEAVAEESPYQFLYFPERIMGLSDRVHGIEADPRGEWMNLKEWWIDPAAR